MARSKFTPEITGKILEMLRAGHFLCHAAEMAGVHRDTVYGWLQASDTDPEKGEFARAVKEASMYACREALATLRLGERGWQAQAWFLERRFSEEWAVKSHHLDEAKTAEKLEIIINSLEAQPKN